MFTKNIFTNKDGIADLVGNILEADYKNKMEELKGNQHKIDKNKNNKIDAHDFKILRGEKKAVEEANEKPGNPFSKDYKSQMQTKPGEKAGFTSKKISTGTVYSRKPPKPEPTKEEVDPTDTTTDTLRGREKTSKNPMLSKKVMMDVPDNVKEEAEEIDEGSKHAARPRSASRPGTEPPVKGKIQDRMAAARERMDAKKKDVKEEAEEIDERTLTKGETAEKERIVKGMKKSLSGFKARYGDRAKSVMYATATKAAKKD